MDLGSFAQLFADLPDEEGRQIALAVLADPAARLVNEAGAAGSAGAIRLPVRSWRGLVERRWGTARAAGVPTHGFAAVLDALGCRADGTRLTLQAVDNDGWVLSLWLDDQGGLAGFALVSRPAVQARAALMAITMPITMPITGGG